MQKNSIVLLTLKVAMFVLNAFTAELDIGCCAVKVADLCVSQLLKQPVSDQERHSCPTSLDLVNQA